MIVFRFVCGIWIKPSMRSAIIKYSQWGYDFFKEFPLFDEELHTELDKKVGRNYEEAT